MRDYTLYDDRNEFLTWDTSTISSWYLERSSEFEKNPEPESASNITYSRYSKTFIATQFDKRSEQS